MYFRNKYLFEVNFNKYTFLEKKLEIFLEFNL